MDLAGIDYSDFVRLKVNIHNFWSLAFLASWEATTSPRVTFSLDPEDRRRVDSQTRKSNNFVRYAIAALKRLPGTIRPSVVGQLKHEILRFTSTLCDYPRRGSIMQVHRHSASTITIDVRGGLEIPTLVTITMELWENNVQVMKTYEELVNGHYKESVNGTIDDVTA